MIFHSKSLKKITSFIPISHYKSSNSLKDIISHYSYLIDNSIYLKSSSYGNSTHAHLIKTGVNNYTFLGNRLLQFYTKLGNIDDSLQVFEEVIGKKLITWNVMLTGLFKFGQFEIASLLFDEMPERDVVSWNTMISGYASNGFVGYALGVFGEMQNACVKPSAYTFSIVMSCIPAARQGKQVHGSIVRSGLNLSNVVLSNSLINMYCKLDIIDYAFGVFLTMEELDVISWNSLILGCGKSDYRRLGLVQFSSMRSSGYSPDQHTMSIVITLCSNLRALEKGKQVFGLCVKLGFHTNTIVTSAAIDLFSKCNRFEDSVRLFKEIHIWDMALCNSMISCYVRHGYEEDAFWLFVMTLRASFQLTEFTLSSILSSASCVVSVEQGTQIHSLVLKLGFEYEAIVASSIVGMYAKVGLIDSAIRIFGTMTSKDLISWNTMILGFARNGRELESLKTFQKLLEQGVLPDRITLAGVLLACSHRGLLNEGSVIFSSMKEKYGITPGTDHYAYVVDMMCQAGKLAEAMQIVVTMPHEPNIFIWESLLCACRTNDDLQLTERVAEIVMKLEPHLSLPYLVLVQAYEVRGRWESVARVRKAMKDRGIEKVSDCSWIGIKNQVFIFEENPVFLSESEGVYSILRLLFWEMVDEGYICQFCANTSIDYG